MPAPKNPWIARHRIICSMVEAKPQKKLATVKPEAEIANSKRVPNARDRNPESGIAISLRQSGGKSAPTTLRWNWPGQPESAQRRRDDLDVQDRHEHPEHHDQKREQPSRRDAVVGRGVRGGRCGGGVGHDQLGTGAGLSPGALRKNYFD
jgi:hypothetical protein